MPDLTTMLRSAEDLQVGAIAQEPYCADPRGASPVETFREAQRRGFTRLPVRDADGHIRRAIPTDALDGIGGWEAALREAPVLDADQLVARDAPVFSLLDRLVEQPVLYTLGRGGVDGVVTVHDLNQPAAHLFAFGVVLVVEAEVAAVLRRHLGGDPASATEQVKAKLGRSPMSLKRWDEARKNDRDLHIASMLTFGEKLELLPDLGLIEMAERNGSRAEDLQCQLENTKEFRNALVHYGEDGRLDDSGWVLSALRDANSLARSIVASAPSRQR